MAATWHHIAVGTDSFVLRQSQVSNQVPGPQYGSFRLLLIDELAFVDTADLLLGTGVEHGSQRSIWKSHLGRFQSDAGN